jgi:hypothetical protein
MSYSCIDQGFGILLMDNQDETIPDHLRPLVADLLRHVAEDAEIDPDTDFDDPEVLRSLVNEDLIPGCFLLYDGNGIGAVGIGFTIKSWPAASLRDTPKGPGIISAARHNHTEAELHDLMAQWSKETADIKEVLDKHKVVPDIFWTSSGS